MVGIPRLDQTADHFVSRPVSTGRSGARDGRLTGRRLIGMLSDMIQLPYLLCWLSWTRRRAKVAPLEPRDQGRLSVYLCGPTVSGSPHLGHGRATSSGTRSAAT